MHLKVIKTYSSNYIDNEIFFLHSMNGYIITNNSYEGILVFDNNLNLITSFILDSAKFLVKEVFFDYQRNRIVFRFEDGLWFVDIIHGDNKYIKLSSEDALIYFPLLYQFDADSICTADRSYIIQWDFNSSYISKLVSIPAGINLKLQDMIDTWYKHSGTYRYLDKDCIITYNGDKDLNLYSFDNRHICNLKLENMKWYKFQLLNGYVLAVSEDEIAIFNIEAGSNIPYRMKVNPLKYYWGATLVDSDDRTVLAINTRNDIDDIATVTLYSISDE